MKPEVLTSELGVAVGSCDLCHAAGVPVLQIDTSGGEYALLQICQPCTSKQFQLRPTVQADAAVGATWQPIETAPVGDVLLVCYMWKGKPVYRLAEAELIGTVEDYIGSVADTGEMIDARQYDVCWFDFTSRARIAPTHWRPLPEPPK